MHWLNSVLTSIKVNTLIYSCYVAKHFWWWNWHCSFASFCKSSDSITFFLTSKATSKETNRGEWFMFLPALQYIESNADLNSNSKASEWFSVNWWHRFEILQLSTFDWIAKLMILCLMINIGFHPFSSVSWNQTI